MILKNFLTNQIMVKRVIFFGLLFCFLVVPLMTTFSVKQNNPLVSVATVSAESSLTGLNTAVVNTDFEGKKPADLKALVGNIIKFVLGFLGIIAIIMIIIGGFMWMTAGGNEEKSKKANALLVNATIGLIIVLAAYAITYTVISAIQTDVLK